MHDADDIELLRQYADEHSEAAFDALVRRHMNLVYSAAMRCVSNAHQAEEITQAVFVILARKARSLRRGVILSGWLYQTARLTAANFRRAETRRTRREQEAHMQSISDESDSDAWCQIAPLLEDAVGCLNEKDRNAIVLRFFEKKSLCEVGRAFGTSEDAAKMRVNRAIEKLRIFFAKRSITLSAAMLAGAVSSQAVQAATAGLAATVAAAAKGSAATVPTLALVKGTLKLMARSKTKIAIAAGAGLLLAGGSAALALKKWEAYQAYRRSLGAAAPTKDSWRNPDLTFAEVEQAVPQVKILPTKFPNLSPRYGPTRSNLKGSADGLRWIGIAAPIELIVATAYGTLPARVTFKSPPPKDRYDFVTTLPEGSLAALQDELKRTLGFTGHLETKEMDVLLLKIQSTGASGLKPATLGGMQNWQQSGRFYCDDVPLSSADPGLQGLASFLERNLGVPIIDQTGLTGYYNIDLRWDARHPNQTEAIKQALANRLGFKLVPGHELIQMLVMEKK